jgi:hypothetical protein
MSLLCRSLAIATTVFLSTACSGSAKPAPEPAATTSQPVTKPAPAAAKCDPTAPVWAKAWSTTTKGADELPPGTGGHLVIVRKGGHYTVARGGKTRQGCLSAAQQKALTDLIARVDTKKKRTRRQTACKAEAAFRYGIQVPELGLAGGGEWALCQSAPPDNGLLTVSDWLNKLAVAPAAAPPRPAAGKLACGPKLQCRGGDQVCLWRVNDIAGGPQDYSCVDGFARCGLTDCACALAQHKRTNPNEYVTCRTKPEGIMLIRPGG